MSSEYFSLIHDGSFKKQSIYFSKNINESNFGTCPNQPANFNHLIIDLHSQTEALKVTGFTNSKFARIFPIFSKALSASFKIRNTIRATEPEKQILPGAKIHSLVQRVCLSFGADVCSIITLNLMNLSSFRERYI